MEDNIIDKKPTKMTWANADKVLATAFETQEVLNSINAELLEFRRRYQGVQIFKDFFYNHNGDDKDFKEVLAKLEENEFIICINREINQFIWRNSKRSKVEELAELYFRLRDLNKIKDIDAKIASRIITNFFNVEETSSSYQSFQLGKYEIKRNKLTKHKVEKEEPFKFIS